VDFCIFARHDPNIRNLIGDRLKQENSIIAGPLFNNPQSSKKEIQSRSKYEFITENEINDYYFSEKLSQSLMCGSIPIYYGCQNIDELVPKNILINLNDFPSNEIKESINNVIEYCKQDSNYLTHFTTVQNQALNWLKDNASVESCISNSLNSYIQELKQARFFARYRSISHYLISQISSYL
jgi:hypothetical protein